VRKVDEVRLAAPDGLRERECDGRRADDALTFATPSGVSSCQSIRITFTNTRMPSLLIAAESERLMSARIWCCPVGSVS